MPVPASLDPHPTKYVRTLNQAGNVAHITVPPSLAKMLGWRIKDLLVIELNADNTLRIRKLDLTEPLVFSGPVSSLRLATAEYRGVTCGVLTDGTVLLLPGGGEAKAFHIRDGLGIVLAHRAGLRTGLLSGRASEVVERRARELGMSVVRQGVADKAAAFREILAAYTSLTGRPPLLPRWATFAVRRWSWPAWTT